MNGLTVLLIGVVFVFLFLLFLVAVAVVAFGVYRMMRAKKQLQLESVAAPLVSPPGDTGKSNVSFGEIALDLSSIDITDGIDERERAIIAKYTTHLCKLVTKQVVEDSKAQAEETIAKALAQKSTPQPVA